MTKMLAFSHKFIFKKQCNFLGTLFRHFVKILRDRVNFLKNQRQKYDFDTMFLKINFCPKVLILPISIFDAHFEIS